MDKVKFDLLQAVKAFGHASAVLSEKWDRYHGEKPTENVGTNEYPFEQDFDSMNSNIGEWARLFEVELEMSEFDLKVIADFQTDWQEEHQETPEAFIVFDHYDQDILNPFRSPCLRFEVEPEKEYGDSYLNSAWHDPIALRQVVAFMEAHDAEIDQNEIDLGNGADNNYPY